MKSLVIVMISILINSHLVFAKVSAKVNYNVKSTDPNRQGLEEGPSAISLLTQTIGPNLGELELVSGINRDKPEFSTQMPKNNPKTNPKSDSSSTNK
jgi:hypothetical protein